MAIFPIVPVPAMVLGRILRRFGKAGAFSEADAKSMEELGFRTHLPLNPSNSLMFRRLVSRGRIVETSGGKYYMDRAYYDARMRMKKAAIPIALAVAAIIMALALLLAR